MTHHPLHPAATLAKYRTQDAECNTTVTQDLNSFFETPNTGSDYYVIGPNKFSSSSNKNINVSHCKSNDYLIGLSPWASSLCTLDFSSFVSNTADKAFRFHAPSQSASNLNIVFNSEKSSSYLFYGSSITMKNSVLISNSYSKLSSNLEISFPSCTFFNCSFTTGTSEKPTTLNHPLVYFDEAKSACLTSMTNPFSEMKPKLNRRAFAHFVIVSD